MDGNIREIFANLLPFIERIAEVLFRFFVQMLVLKLVAEIGVVIRNRLPILGFIREVFDELFVDS